MAIKKITQLKNHLGILHTFCGTKGKKHPFYLNTHKEPANTKALGKTRKNSLF